MDTLPDIGTTPDWGLSQGGQFRVRSVGFGDGYEQRAPDGLNSVRRAWKVKWTLLSREQRNLIYDFLVEKKGVHPFIWEVPTEGETVQVLCRKKPSWSHDDYESFSLSAEFTEDFTP